MIEVLRTSDPVRLNYAAFLLEEAGCRPFVADRHTAENGALRLLVPDEFAALAQTKLKLLDAPRPARDVSAEDDE